MVSRTSGDPHYLGDIKAVYTGGLASEVTDPTERELAWGLLSKRHPNVVDFGPPYWLETALMRAACKYVSVLDYSDGIGQSEEFTVGEAG